MTSIIKLQHSKCLNHPPFIAPDRVGEADLGNTGVCEGLAEAAVMCRLAYTEECGSQTQKRLMDCEEPAIIAEWCWG